jgi:hypothetical protein
MLLVHHSHLLQILNQYRYQQNYELYYFHYFPYNKKNNLIF